MNRTPEDMDPSEQVRSLFGENPTITFKGGGWILLAAAVFSIALLSWALSSVIFGDRPIGDGSNIDSYEFNLEDLDVSPKIITTSGNPRDFLSTYDFPQTILGKDILAYNSKSRRPWLVTADRVVGVFKDGHARAYPVRCLNAHEIIKDKIGTDSIVVTYSPFADAPIVVDHVPGHPDLDFGVSGLLCDSALLMYNRNSETPSLWSPLLGRAISGPLVGTKLERVPDVNLCTWSDWLAAHPDTTVVLPDPSAARRYRDFSYLRYFNDLSDSLEFPVEPLPVTSRRDAGFQRLKARVIAVTAGGVRRVWPVTMLVNALGAEQGVIEVTQGGVLIQFEVNELPQSALVRSLDGSRIDIQPRLWFAWWCAHPTTAAKELVRTLPSDARISPRRK